ncbi:MAG: prolyl oligopeptidase family serine peptidase [Planctomycetaceae bacterium]
MQAIQSGDVDPEDPFVWLEEIDGDRALEWVRGRNADCLESLARGEEFATLESRLLGILDSKARIPLVTRLGGSFVNFWRDATHPRGLWRRTSLDGYRLAEPPWETILDLDRIATDEDENWVWHGATVLEPDDRLCLVQFSRGGADAEVIREFDLVSKRFVEGGFVVPEAKTTVSWKDRDTLLVATDFGPGSLTDSGYARSVREWRRGTPLASALVVYEGEPQDMRVMGFVDRTPGFEREFVLRQRSFYSNELFARHNARLHKLPKPDDASALVHRQWVFLELRSDWSVGGRSWKAGSLLVADFDRFLDGEARFESLFEPTERSSLKAFAPTRGSLLIATLENVRTRVFSCRFEGGQWRREAVVGVPETGTASVVPLDELDSDDFFLVTASPLSPSTLSLVTDPMAAGEPLKSTPAFFNAESLVVSRHEAVSKDGTRVPYYQVSRESLPADGSTPTLLYGYGGFEIPLLPDYNPLVGAAWLERGRAYVVANIRGGGEFGPRWHQAALRENRPRAYEDFIAVAEDLVRRKVTSPSRLGIKGGSNGGLLVGNMLAMRPDLFGAVVCQVPLLDMRRYNRLLAGASWMEEYGDPDDPAQWAFIRGFSPYHAIERHLSGKVAASERLPPLLLTTSTRDDRVHPGHARKMAAKLLAAGANVLSYENIEGGHGGAADNRQRAFMEALGYVFLERELNGSGRRTSGGR